MQASIVKSNKKDYIKTQQTPPGCLFHPHSSSTLSNTLICLSQYCDVRANTIISQTQSKDSSPRILCAECLDQQRHAGHVVINFIKFNAMINQYRLESQKSCTLVLQKFTEFRKEINQLLDLFQRKIISILTYDCTLSQEKDDHHRNNVKQQIHYNHNIEMSTKISNLSQWNDILRSKKEGKDAKIVIEDILMFKQDIVFDQIENISELITQNIIQSMDNIQFITMNKNLLFNPEDMHSKGVGLTLNRNILEAVEADGNKIVSSICNNEQSMSSVAFTGCKLAFTEVCCKSDLSKSFQIKKINTKLLIGCVDQQSHQLINEEFAHENCEKLIYGISIGKDGEVIAYSKINAPVVIPQVIVKQGDIVELTVHLNQNSLSFVHYSSFSYDQQNTYQEIDNQKDYVYSSMMGSFRKNIITSIDLQPIETDQVIYCFAGVAREGDEIKLIENVILVRKILQKCANKTNRSIQINDQDSRQILTYLNHLNGEDPEDITNLKL